MQHPIYLLLFFLILLFIFLKRKETANAFSIPILDNIANSKQNRTLTTLYNYFPLLIISTLIFALSNPYFQRSYISKSYEGVDIVIALDCSRSMLATDILPNRFEVAKQTTIDFIQNRKNDRIAAVGFAGERVTISPLVKNHNHLVYALNSLDIENYGDGTAIGNALATSLLRLDNSDAKSKIIILLSDGVNNCGNISPEEASSTASIMNVKVYTIGIGSRNNIGRTDATGYDPKMLTQIAEETGGKFYEATSRKALDNIYLEIDQLERSIIYENILLSNINIGHYLLLLSLLFVAIELIIKVTTFKYI